MPCLSFLRRTNRSLIPLCGERDEMEPDDLDEMRRLLSALPGACPQSRLYEEHGDEEKAASVNGSGNVSHAMMHYLRAAWYRGYAECSQGMSPDDRLELLKPLTAPRG